MNYRTFEVRRRAPVSAIIAPTSFVALASVTVGSLVKLAGVPVTPSWGQVGYLALGLGLAFLATRLRLELANQQLATKLYRAAG